MKLIEFGSSRVKVYENGVMTGYHSLNLIAKEGSIAQIEKELRELVADVGVPDKSFFTEWVRGHDGILHFLKTCDFLGEIIVLSGEDEAIAFVKAVERQYKEEAIICDIGGGSVQIQTLEKELFSFRSGSIYLEKNIIGHSIPFSQDECRKVYDTLVETYAPMKGLKAAEKLIVGSTQVQTFFQSFFEKTVEKGYVTTDELKAGIDFLSGKTYEEIRHIYPKQEGYMYGVQLLLMNALVMAQMFNIEKVIPTNASWIQYYL